MRYYDLLVSLDTLIWEWYCLLPLLYFPVLSPDLVCSVSFTLSIDLLWYLFDRDGQHYLENFLRLMMLKLMTGFQDLLSSMDLVYTCICCLLVTDLSFSFPCLFCTKYNVYSVLHFSHSIDLKNFKWFFSQWIFTSINNYAENCFMVIYIDLWSYLMMLLPIVVCFHFILHPQMWLFSLLWNLFAPEIAEQ